MDDINKKQIWSLILKKGDSLKNKLQEHPNHPKGRNPYAHICGLIKDKFNCSYKDVSTEKLQYLKNFIENIDN
ncbi:MAG: hypothetical protein CMP34_00595 [Rickettsiales bacterium]|nr:hypothetical protein [Rickettsiales bacterium]|tara:strand:+ start:73 stop:291 length:219 start_codon:yes stop_codon:yes gene_type:complete